jgi:hypothetical protein
MQVPSIGHTRLLPYPHDSRAGQRMPGRAGPVPLGHGTRLWCSGLPLCPLRMSFHLQGPDRFRLQGPDRFPGDSNREGTISPHLSHHERITRRRYRGRGSHHKQGSAFAAGAWGAAGCCWSLAEPGVLAEQGSNPRGQTPPARPLSAHPSPLTSHSASHEGESRGDSEARPLHRPLTRHSAASAPPPGPRRNRLCDAEDAVYGVKEPPRAGPRAP